MACAASLVAIGPAMALQELARAQEQEATQELTGHIPAVDGAFRALWRLPLTILVIVSGILGTFAAIRVLIDANVRRVARRVLIVLIVALALLYVTYYLDGALFFAAPYGLRAASIVWMYPLTGILIAGSIHRIAQLHAYFGVHATPRGFRL